METYLVGGAVRDKLLGYPVSERDWVVVGVTAEDMLEAGYRPVGKDFPVFLHPETKEEYALARTERKTGKGYTGFHCFSSPEVSLEEDLKRRDLTINAIAEDDSGNLIDPYGGCADLDKRLLRHVSVAFMEDPLRILRVARFYARYHHLGFEIADETLELMSQMVARGELEELVAERVWMELHRVLQSHQPDMFFRVLAQIDGLQYLLPTYADRELLDRAMQILTQLSELKAPTVCLFSGALFPMSEKSIREWCSEYRVPGEYKELALLVKKNCGSLFRDSVITAQGLLAMLEDTDAFRRPDRFNNFVAVCEVVSQLDSDKSNANPAPGLLREARGISASIGIKDIDSGIQGKAIGDAISARRIELIEQFLRG